MICVTNLSKQLSCHMETAHCFTFFTINTASHFTSKYMCCAYALLISFLIQSFILYTYTTSPMLTYTVCQQTTHTQTHPFNGPFSRTTRVSQYQKVKPNCILLKQETMSGSGIRWAICKSAPRSRQITTPAPNHSVSYRPDALPAAQPTASKQ